MNTQLERPFQACSSHTMGAVDLADFALHPYRALRARGTMRLLRKVVGSLLTCLGVKDTLRPDRC